MSQSDITGVNYNDVASIYRDIVQGELPSTDPIPPPILITLGSLRRTCNLHNVRCRIDIEDFLRVHSFSPASTLVWLGVDSISVSREVL